MYDTVTEEFRLPVLVRARPEKQEGLSTFEQELSPPCPVRIFKNSELKDARKHLTVAEVQHFTAVVELIQALKNPSDTIALKRAKDGFEEVYKAKRAEPSDLIELGEEFANALAKFTGQPPREAVETLERKRPGPRAAADPRWLLSYEVSEMLTSSCRLVLWWTGERFTPAIWCDDIKTAFYVRALLSVVGGVGLRICPHCGDVFFQERRDQNYCSIAHREAHRAARWRAAQLSKHQKKGGKNVAKKTR
ncbi:MAG: hypothetical protein WA188_22065 [Terriglobales bacterium]